MIKLIKNLSPPAHGFSKIEFSSSELDLKVVFYRDGPIPSQDIALGYIEFEYAAIIKFEAESVCLDFVEDACDSLCCLEDSKWKRNQIDKIGQSAPLKHYVIYFSNCGYLQVASLSATVVEGSS